MKQVQLTETNLEGLAGYVGGEVRDDVSCPGKRYMMIDSPEGSVRVDIGDTVAIETDETVTLLP